MVAKSLMPYNVNECLFVQLPGNLTACKFVCVSFGCRQSNGACCAVEYLANIVAVGERRTSALDSAEELTPDGRLYMADRQTVLDSNGTAIAVTYKATKGATTRSGVVVDYITVEQTVGNVGYSIGVVVHITYDTTIVAVSTCIVAVECARVGTVLNGGLIGSSKDTTKDTALSATC